MDTTLEELLAEIGEHQGCALPMEKKRSRKSKAKAVASPSTQPTLELPDLSGIFDNKERNRIIVKRCYYRKLTTLSELRSKAERLEAQYEQLIRVEHENSLAPSSAAELAQKTRVQEIRDAFVELAMISAALRRENEQLQQTLINVEKTEKQLTQLYIAQHKKAERMKALMDANKQMPIIQVRRITSIECAEVMARAHNRITVFRESTDSFSSGVSVFGWRDRYQQVKDDIEFSMEKTFPSHSLESVADKTWDIFSHCETFAHMYPASLNASFHELQRLDENYVLFFHTLQMSGQDLLAKCLMLCSRVSLMNGDGCVLIFRSLDPRLYVISEGEVDTNRDRRGRHKLELKAEELWINVLSWCYFRRSGPNDEHCVVEFGGTSFATPMVAASWWLVERLRSMLKFEELVFGSTNLLVAA